MSKLEVIQNLVDDLWGGVGRPAKWRNLAALCLAICKSNDFGPRFDRGMEYLERHGALERIKKSGATFKTLKSQALRTLREGVNSQGKRVDEIFGDIDSAATFEELYDSFLNALADVARSDHALARNHRDFELGNSLNKSRANAVEVQSWELDAEAIIRRLWEHGEVNALRRLRAVIDGYT